MLGTQRQLQATGRHGDLSNPVRLSADGTATRRCISASAHAVCSRCPASQPPDASAPHLAVADAAGGQAAGQATAEQARTRFHGALQAWTRVRFKAALGI